MGVLTGSLMVLDGPRVAPMGTSSRDYRPFRPTPAGHKVPVKPGNRPLAARYGGAGC
jgi:hypothetical protein